MATSRLATSAASIRDALKRAREARAPVAEAAAAPAASYQPSEEELADMARMQGMEDRFGNDMAWTDPAFQYDAAQIDANGEVGRDAQLRALDQLFGVAGGGGFSESERGARMKSRMEQEGWLRGQREADMQNMAERGMAGSGAELLSLGQANQTAAQQMALSDATTTAQGEQRALDALMAAGDIGGKLTSANDRISQLNQGAVNDARSANTQYLQTAQKNMLDKRQQWAKEGLDRNADIMKGLMDTDVAENKYGFDQAKALGMDAADTFNDAQGAYRGAVLGQAGVAGKDYQTGKERLAETATATAGAGGDLLDTMLANGGGGLPTGGTKAAPRTGGDLYTEDEVFGKK